MAKNKTKKIIQVPIEDDLLKRIDASASVVAESRAAFIREACQQRLKRLQVKELDRLYMEGHRSQPEDLVGEELRWTAVQTTAERKVVNEAR